MFERLKDKFFEYGVFVARIPEHVGELIACTLYVLFCSGLVLIVLGLSNNSEFIVVTGAGLSATICALVFAA